MLAHFKTRCGCTKVIELVSDIPWPLFKIPLSCSKAELMAETSGVELTIEVRLFELSDYYPISNEVYYEEVKEIK